MYMQDMLSGITELAEDFYKPKAVDAFGNTLDIGDHVLVWNDDDGYQRARVTGFGKDTLHYVETGRRWTKNNDRITFVYGSKAHRVVKVAAPEANLWTKRPLSLRTVKSTTSFAD